MADSNARNKSIDSKDVAAAATTVGASSVVAHTVTHAAVAKGTAVAACTAACAPAVAIGAVFGFAIWGIAKLLED